MNMTKQNIIDWLITNPQSDDANCGIEVDWNGYSVSCQILYADTEDSEFLKINDSQVRFDYNIGRKFIEHFGTEVLMNYIGQSNQLQ